MAGARQTWNAHDEGIPFYRGGLDDDDEKKEALG